MRSSDDHGLTNFLTNRRGLIVMVNRYAQILMNLSNVNQVIYCNLSELIRRNGEISSLKFVRTP